METVFIAIAITLVYFVVGMIISCGFVKGGHPLIASIWPLIITVYILMFPIALVLRLSGATDEKKTESKE